MSRFVRFQPQEIKLPSKNELFSEFFKNDPAAREKMANAGASLIRQKLREAHFRHLVTLPKLPDDP